MMQCLNGSKMMVSAFAVVAAAGVANAVPSFNNWVAVPAENELRAIFRAGGFPNHMADADYVKVHGSDVSFANTFSFVERAEVPTTPTGLDSAFVESRSDGTFSSQAVRATGSVKGSFVKNSSYTTGSISNLSGSSTLLFEITLTEAAPVRVRFSGTADGIGFGPAATKAYLTLPSLDPTKYVDGLVFGVMSDASTPGGVRLQTSGTLQATAASLDFTFNAKPGAYLFQVNTELGLANPFDGGTAAWDLKLDIVPAPASAALLGMGGLVAARRRRAC